MKTLFSLLQLSREELLELADSRIPASVTSQVEAEALSPALVAQCSLELVAEVIPGNLPSTRVVEKLGFLNSGTRVDKDNETVVQWVWTNDLHPLALVGLQQ